MLVNRIVLLVVCAQLVACGSGDTEPVTPTVTNNPAGPTPGSSNSFVHFEGVWQGTITPDDTMSSGMGIVFVNGWGEFRLLASDVQFIGFPRRTFSELQGNLTGLRSPGSEWSDGTRVSPFTISGAIDEDNFIDATYYGSAGSGSLALAWVSSTDSTNIGATNGMWVLFDDDQNYLATFEIEVTNEWEATITGAHSNGCNYSGVAESWTSFNSYDISKFDISDCPLIAGIDANGEYSGTAARIDIADDGTGELALVLGLSNGQNQLTYFLYRP